MMQIIKKYVGKHIDFDKAYWAQCVDLVRQHAKDTGHPISTFGGSALNGWLTGAPFVGTQWKRVTNTTTAIPKPWDIIFLDKTPNNPYGHTAIALAGCTGSKLVILEQNAGTGNGDGKGANKTRIAEIKYNDKARGICLGWYSLSGLNDSTFKKMVMEEVAKGYTVRFEDFDDKTVATLGDVKALIEIFNIRQLKDEK